MVSTDQGDGGSEEGVSRRGVLAAAGSAAAASLAGCEHDSGPSTTRQGPEPDVTLQDVRVVQVVEDSRLGSGGQGFPDPPLVAGAYATVLFDLDVTHPENLPATVPVAVSTPTVDFDYTQVLSRADVRAIADGGDAPAVFHRTATTSGPGDPPGVQRLPEGVREITVKLLHPDVDGDEVTLTEGPNGDFEVRTLPPLRVGFVHVKDPGSAQSPVVTQYEANNDPNKQYTTDIDWGDANGEAANYERSVRSSMAFLRRAYPGDVVAYSHDETNPMLGTIRENWPDATGKDANRARTALNVIRQSSSFPTRGSIHTDEGITEGEVIDMIDADTGGAFDVRVMILPRGTHGVKQDYFDAHGMDVNVGYFWSTSQAVSSLETLAAGEDTSHVQITAQEIAHRYAFSPYTGQFAAGQNDTKHSDSRLQSVGYDLNDGTYTLVNDYEVPDGNFDAGEVQGSGSDASVSPITTCMKPRSGGDTWTDSRIVRFFVDGQYSPGYSGGSPRLARGAAPTTGDDAGASTQESAVQPVFEAFASVVDGTPQVESSTVSDAVPQDARGGRYDPARHPDATPVAVTVEGPEGEPLVTATVPDRHGGSHGHRVHASAAISVPLPELGVALVADRDGQRARLNAIVHPLRDAVGRVPDAGIAGDPQDVRPRLDETLDGVAVAMDAGDYGGAREELGAFASDLDESVVADYERFAGQPDRERLDSLVERMRARLAALAEATPDPDPTGPFSLELPDGTTREVTAVERDRTVADYYGYGRGPSDSSSTPDGLEREDATVTFLYRNAGTGEVSLVCLNGDATSSSDGGGRAPVTFRGVEGAEWQVQDGRPGSGFGDFDPYETAEGPLGASETVIWGWDDSKTDGGAIGPLRSGFDVDVVHLAEGTVGETTVERQGIDEWVFVDGRNLENPVELATFDEGTGDVSASLSNAG